MSGSIKSFLFSAVAKMKALGLKKKQNEDDILLKATALLNDFKVSLVSEKRNIATFWVGSIIAEYEDKLLKSRIFAQVSDVEMTNLDTPSLYTRVSDGSHLLQNNPATSVNYFFSPQKHHFIR